MKKKTHWSSGSKLNWYAFWGEIEANNCVSVKKNSNMGFAIIKFEIP